MCKISIVMPVYNKQKYLARSIRSVLNQTMDDWELIIIDDGSTDDSSSVCKQFVNHKVHLYQSENRGVSHARNLGISKAQGDYITFLDADDWIGDKYLESLYSEQCDCIVGGLKKINTMGETLETVAPILTGQLSISEVCANFYREQYETGIYGYIASKMIKRELIVANHILFDENIKLAEDYDFFLKVYSVVKHILFVEHSEYYYEQNTTNSAINVSDDNIDFIQQIIIQNRTKDFLIANNAYGVWEEDHYQKMISGYVYTILLVKAPQGRKEFLGAINELKSLGLPIKNVGSMTERIVLLTYNCRLTLLTYYILLVKEVLFSKRRKQYE